MGYELHITRREHWADTEASNIPLEEWITYINGDKELELTNGSDPEIGEEMEFQNRPGFCEWNAHPIEKATNSRPWLAYWQGSIDTKNPDTPTIRKMIKIASALQANVQGDDGEIYTEDYLAELEKSKQQKIKSRQQENKPWWKVW